MIDATKTVRNMFTVVRIRRANERRKIDCVIFNNDAVAVDRHTS